MKLVDDDEVYEIDSSYLGPPGRYIGVMKHKVIFLWMIVGPIVGVSMRRLGIEFTLMTVGLAVIAVTGIVLWLADRISYERPVGALASSFWNEVTAPRTQTRAQHSTAADVREVGRPKGSLRRFAEDRAAKRQEVPPEDVAEEQESAPEDSAEQQESAPEPVTENPNN